MSRRFRFRSAKPISSLGLFCALALTTAGSLAIGPARGEDAMPRDRVRAAAEAARLQELNDEILAGRPSSVGNAVTTPAGAIPAGRQSVGAMAHHPMIDAIHSGRIDGEERPTEELAVEETIEDTDGIVDAGANGFDPAEEDWSFLQPKKKLVETAPVVADADPLQASDPMIDPMTTASASAHDDAPASAHGDIGDHGGHSDHDNAAEATHAGEAPDQEEASSHGETSVDHAEVPEHETPQDAAGHGETAHDGGGHDETDPAESGHGEAPHEVAGTDDGAHGEEGEHTGTPAEWETTRSPMPYEIVRSLQFLQDQVARGNKAAIRVQARLLKWFGPSLVRRSPEIWEDRRNVRAAALFVLSGGPPSVLRDLIARGVFKDHDMPLLEGSLAYAENKLEVALEKLSRIDLSREETVFAAQVNLALAQLLQEKQPAESLKRLEAVMLAAPGTLLDEAALRLGVLLAEDLGETKKADLYARQYFDRYAASVYAGNFRARFSAVYSMRPAGTEIDTIETLRNALRLLPPEEQLALYLSVGRRALVLGNLKLAAMASARALTFDDASPEDRQRALLYSVASTLSERDEGEMRAMLASIEDERLHQADLALKRAVFDVVNAIRAPVDMAEASEPGGPAVDNKVLARANSLLQAVRNDLETLDQ